MLSLLDRMILSLMVGPIQRDLRITDTEFGLLQGFAFAIFYSIAGYPLGWLADRYSRRNIAVIGIAMWSFMTAISGLASSFGYLFLARIGVGLGEASLQPVAYSMMSDMFPANKLGRAVGVFQTGALLGAGLAFFGGGMVVARLSGSSDLSVPIIGAIHPWQGAFFIAGLPGLALAMLFLAVSEPARLTVRTLENSSSSALLAFMIARKRVLTLIFLSMGSLSIATYAFMSWAPEMLIRKRGFEPFQSGLAMGIATAIFGGCGYYCGGLAGDWFMRKGRPDAAVRFSASALLVALPLALLTTLASDVGVSLVALCGFFFSAFLCGAPITAGLQLITPPLLRGRISALFFLCISLAGIGIGSLIVGLITDHVFADRGAIHLSLAIVASIGLVGGTLSLTFAIRPFRHAIASRDI
jgi:MFS family permease